MFDFFGKKNDSTIDSSLSGQGLAIVAAALLCDHGLIKKVAFSRVGFEVIGEDALARFEAGNCRVGTWIKTDGHRLYAHNKHYLDLVACHVKYRALMVDLVNRRDEMTSRDRLDLLSPFRKTDFSTLIPRMLRDITGIEISDTMPASFSELENDDEHKPIHHTHVQRAVQAHTESGTGEGC